MSRNCAGDCAGPPHMPPNRYQSSLLACPNCTARGAATWDQSCDNTETRRTLIQVSGDFHVETGRTIPDSKVIVCNLRDQILPTTESPPAASSPVIVP